MIRRFLAIAAACALVIALPLHLTGGEQAAEDAGTVAFCALLLATLLPAWRERSPDGANGARE